jgi:hypothetical protein
VRSVPQAESTCEISRLDSAYGPRHLAPVSVVAHYADVQSLIGRLTDWDSILVAPKRAADGLDSGRNISYLVIIRLGVGDLDALICCEIAGLDGGAETRWKIPL